MKKMLSLLLTLVVLLSVLPCALAADEPDPIPVLIQDEIPETPYGIHHYMLICIDNWDSMKYLGGIMDSWSSEVNAHWGLHTDGMILVTVDEGMGRVMLTIFDRDMLIQRPDGKFGRINNYLDKDGWTYAAQKTAVDGFNALIDTINSHFGLRVEKYIVVDFKMVENIIDAVGGVDVKLSSYPRDNNEVNRLKSFGISLPAQNSDGSYHLQGYAAVIYMRIRKSRTVEYLHNDGKVYADTDTNGRAYRDYAVLSSIADSLSDISYNEATRLLNVIISNTVYTNMTQDDMMDALDLAMDLKGITVEHIRMPIDGTYEEFAYVGMATKQIDFVANREALHSFLFDNFIVVEDE